MAADHQPARHRDLVSGTWSLRDPSLSGGCLCLEKTDGENPLGTQAQHHRVRVEASGLRPLVPGLPPVAKLSDMAAGPEGTTVVFHSLTSFQPPLFPVLLGAWISSVRSETGSGEWCLVNRARPCRTCSLQGVKGASIDRKLLLSLLLL